MKRKKMNNKGFTLIELLVAMTILSIITAMAIPLMRNLTNTVTNRKYETYKDSLVYASKLYVDSYSEDLFDHRESGCAYIDIDSLIERNLAKDIEMDNISCKNTKTYVQVVKVGNEYTYTPYITCGVKNDNSTNIDREFNYPEGEHTKDETACGFESNFNMDIVPSKETSITSAKTESIDITVNSYTGINPNVDISYAFATAEDISTTVTEWRKLTFKVPSTEKQRSKILEGETISIKSNTITTPDDADGILYLVIKVNNMIDLYGESWSKVGDKTKFYGPYRLDNSAPSITGLDLYKSNGHWYSNIDVTDKTNYERFYRICPNAERTISCEHKNEFKLDVISNNVLDDYVYKPGGTYDMWYDYCAKVIDAAGNISEKTCSSSTSYKIRLYANDGTNNYETATITLNSKDDLLSNSDVTSNQPNPRPGYKFLYWTTDKNGNNQVRGDLPFVDSWNKLYAQWEQETSTLHFININPKNRDDDEYVTVPAEVRYCLPDKQVDGYTFLGWTSRRTMGTPIKGESACYTPHANDVYTTYSATWEPNSYTITLTNLASNNETISYTTSEDTITIDNPTKSGYTFTGWTGTGLNKKTKNLVLPAYTFGNKTFTANWSRN